MSIAFDELNLELELAGVPTRVARNVKGTTIETDGPVNVLVNSRHSAKPYAEILLRHAPQLSGNELEMVVRALTEKGIFAATEYLLTLCDKEPPLHELHLWAVANALKTINDPGTRGRIVALCQRTRGMWQQPFMELLGRMKDSSSFDVLVRCLDDPTLRGHAIAALGRRGDPRALPYLQCLSVQKGKYEARALKRALDRLQK